MECQEATTMKSRQHDTLTWKREPIEPQLQAIRNAGSGGNSLPQGRALRLAVHNIRCAEQVHVYI